MPTTYKEIYEIDRINVSERIQQVQNFISISRSFSTKVHGHLKILVHLVNNLIESEDNLELVDTNLKMPDVVKEKQTNQTIVTHYQTNVENKEEKSQNPEVNKILDSFKSEYIKIKDSIDQGQQNTVFIKEIFSKLLDQLAKKDDGKETKSTKIINELQCPHCSKGPHGNCQQHYFVPPPYGNPNQHYSVYVPHTYQQQPDDLDKNNAQSLQNDIRQLKEELKRKQKDGEKERDQDASTIDKLLREKEQLEDDLRAAQDRIEDLTEEVEISTLSVRELIKSKDELIEQNRDLEKLVRQLLADKNVEEIDPEKEILERENLNLKNLADDLEHEKDNLKKKVGELQNKMKDLKDQAIDGMEFENKNLKFENDQLKGDLDRLQRLNDKLNDQNKDLESDLKNKKQQVNKDDDNPTYNHTDFLKCMYAQAFHIETNNQDMMNRNRYSHI